MRQLAHVVLTSTKSKLKSAPISALIPLDRQNLHYLFFDYRLITWQF